MDVVALHRGPGLARTHVRQNTTAPAKNCFRTVASVRHPGLTSRYRLRAAGTWLRFNDDHSPLKNRPACFASPPRREEKRSRIREGAAASALPG